MLLLKVIVEHVRVSQMFICVPGKLGGFVNFGHLKEHKLISVQRAGLARAEELWDILSSIILSTKVHFLVTTQISIPLNLRKWVLLRVFCSLSF